MLVPDLSRTPLLWEGVLGVQSLLQHCWSLDCGHLGGGGGGGAHEVSSCHRPGIPSTPPSTQARRCGLWDGGDGRVELAPSPFSSTWTGYFQEKNLSYEALQLPGMCV